MSYYENKWLYLVSILLAFKTDYSQEAIYIYVLIVKYYRYIYVNLAPVHYISNENYTFVVVFVRGFVISNYKIMDVMYMYIYLNNK